MPVNRPYRGYGESRIAYELRYLSLVLQDENPTDILVRRLVDRLNNPISQLEFATGFLTGFSEGASERLRAWWDDLEALHSAIVKFIKSNAPLELAVAIDVSLYEFFRGAFQPKRPSGLSPEVVSALERLELMHDLAAPLAMLESLNQVVAAGQFLDMLGLAAEDIAIAMVQEGGAWIARFLRADAGEQGRLLGRLMGEAVVEIARAFIEPGELSLAELAANLAMSDDEVAALAGANAP
jgi:hypothetical protein